MSSEREVIKVLFVCFGNTCRSPMGEAILKDLVRKKGMESKFYIDSAAISDWQVGCDTNKYVIEILERIGIKDFNHKARQISYQDFKNFDYIFGMDYYHINELNNGAQALQSNSKIFLLGNFYTDPCDKVIRDPICGPRSEFQKCYEQISVSCERFLDQVLNKSI